MATVTGLTAAAMNAIRDATVVDAHISGDNLILELFDSSTIDAGSVRGPIGPGGSLFDIVTSGTRPALSGSDEGYVIYETDTKLIRVWTGTRWRLQERIICTSSTRPAGLGVNDEGVKIYETDTNLEYIWTGSAWSKPWQMAWGIVAEAAPQTNDITTNGGTVDVRSLTFNAVQNRRYRYILRTHHFTNHVDDTLRFFLADGANVLKGKEGYFDVQIANNVNPSHDLFVANEDYTAASASITRKWRMTHLSFVAAVGHAFADVNRPRTYFVEDVGPV